MPHILRALAGTLAICLVTGIVWHLGPRLIWDNLHRVGWKIGFVFFLGFPRFFVNTVGWQLLLPKQPFSLSHLYRVKIAGELLTRATPLHFFGGDTARVLLFGKEAPRTELAASVLMDRTAITLGGAFFILTGLLIGPLLLPLPTSVKVSLTALMAAIFLGLAFLILQQKKGVARFARYLPEKKRAHWEGKLRSFDQTVIGYYQKGHGKLIGATALNYLSRWVASLEILILFWILEIPLGALHAVLFCSLSLFLTAAFFVVPGTLGISEGTYGLFFHLLKLDPTVGVSLELSRKVNALLWFGFGGLLALTFRRSDTTSSKR